jgi:hypothetical protein
MCKASVVKLIYRHVGGNVWEMIKSKHAKVIHLTRMNDLRASCSFLFHKSMRLGKVAKRKMRRKLHVYTPSNSRSLVPKPMHIDGNDLIRTMGQRKTQRETWARKIEQAKLEAMTITYAELTGGERAEASKVPPHTSEALCKFLKVPVRALRGPTRKVNAYPLRELIANWAEIEKTVGQSQFAKHLALEEKWQQNEEGLWILPR